MQWNESNYEIEQREYFELVKDKEYHELLVEEYLGDLMEIDDINLPKINKWLLIVSEDYDSISGSQLIIKSSIIRKFIAMYDYLYSLCNFLNYREEQARLQVVEYFKAMNNVKEIENWGKKNFDFGRQLLDDFIWLEEHYLVEDNPQYLQLRVQTIRPIEIPASDLFHIRRFSIIFFGLYLNCCLGSSDPNLFEIIRYLTMKEEIAELETFRY